MSDLCDKWSIWLKETRFAYMNEKQIKETLAWLLSVKDKIIDMAELQNNQKIIDLGCGDGLVGLGVIEKYQDNIDIVFQDKFLDCLETCKKNLAILNIPNKAIYHNSDILNINIDKETFDRALMRSVLVHIVDKKTALEQVYNILKYGGIFCAFEPIIAENTKYCDLLDESQVSFYNDFKKAELEFMASKNDSLVNFNAKTLQEDVKEIGFVDYDFDLQEIKSKYIVTKETVNKWFLTPPSPCAKTVKERFLEYFSENKVDNYIKEASEALSNSEVEIISKVLFMKVKK